MKLPKATKILHNRPYDLINSPGIHIWTGYERSHHAKSRDVTLLSFVKNTRRDICKCIEGVGINKAFFNRRVEVYKVRSTAINRLPYSAIGNSNGIGDSIDFTVT